MFRRSRKCRVFRMYMLYKVILLGTLTICLFLAGCGRTKESKPIPFSYTPIFHISTTEGICIGYDCIRNNPYVQYTHEVTLLGRDGKDIKILCDEIEIVRNGECTGGFLEGTNVKIGGGTIRKEENKRVLRLGLKNKQYMGFKEDYERSKKDVGENKGDV